MRRVAVVDVHRVRRLVGVVEGRDDDAVIASFSQLDCVPCNRSCLDRLHDRRDAHAAADAEGGRAVPAAPVRWSSSMSVPGIMPPSGAERMAHRDRAVDV